MIGDYISVGDKLELQKIKTRETELNENKVYLSKILDFVGTDKANITMPIIKGRIIPLTVGDKYILCFYTNKGLFQCKGVITARFKINNIYTLEVQFLSELEKFQRRQFYRLECNLDMNYHITTEAERMLEDHLKRNKFKNDEEKELCITKLEEYKNVWQKGIITDISGGGARFISTNALKTSDSIEIAFDLITNEGVKSNLLPVNIISSSLMLNRQGYYEHRVQFRDITREKREEIIKFIFEEDRRQRKREKGYN